MLHHHLAKALPPLAALLLGLSLTTTSAQESPRIALDANPAGNTATTAGAADSCIAVQPGDEFAVQILVTDVEELFAFQIDVAYDADLLAPSGRDTNLFLNSNSGSRVTDVSTGDTSEPGIYNISAVDTADPPRPDTGSGALAEITFTALSEGTASINFLQRDLDETDGRLDSGPLLRDINVENIGDTNGDTFFDGEWTPVEARIGGMCDGPAPTQTGDATPGDNGGTGGSGGNSDGGGIGAVGVIALAAGGLVLVGAILAGGRYLFRRANRPAV